MRRRSLFRNINSNQPNLLIGNASSFITNETDLAARLGDKITPSDITYFNISGSDIESRVIKDYDFLNAPNFAFNNTAITHFKDLEGRCIKIERVNCFNSCDNLTEIEFPAVTNIANFAFSGCVGLIGEFTFPSVTNLTMAYYTFNGASNITALYFPSMTSYSANSPTNTYSGTGLTKLSIPVCATIGSTTGDNGVFTSLPVGCEIICPTSLQTSNGGAEEGDIAYARNTKSATITYV